MQPQLEEFSDRLRGDIVFFTKALWGHLGLDLKHPIGEVESDMLQYAVHGPRKRGILARRSIGKTHLVAAACTLFDLVNDPDAKILIVSKSAGEAEKTIYIIKQWIRVVPWLKWLDPARRRNARDTATQFDVAPAQWSRDPSVSACGIDGQIPGRRATKVIPDDIETPSNTKTVKSRQELDEIVREFSNVATFGRREIVYIGTYHHEESVYLKLMERDYAFRSWPICFPRRDDKIMGLAPMVLELIESGKGRYTTSSLDYSNNPIGENVSSEMVIEKQSEGPLNFAQQHMLIAHVAAADRKLHISDLIIPDFDFSRDQAPSWVKWGKTDSNGNSTHQEGFPAMYTGDYFRRPFRISSDFVPYQGTKMRIDPSGGGKDETGYAIASNVNGYLWVKDVGGFVEGHSPQTMSALALAAREWGVTSIRIESQFGMEMFAELLWPYLLEVFIEPGDDPRYPRGWKCGRPECIPATGQKERRIITSMQPVMAQHRLVVNPECLRPTDGLDGCYELQYQIHSITPDVNSIECNDRIDTLAAVIADWTEDEVLHHNPEDLADRRRQRVLDEIQREHLRACGIISDRKGFIYSPGR